MKRSVLIGSYRQFFAAASLMLFVFITAAAAAPHNGEEFTLRQPDGSEVRVIVWGDEFYQDVESPDGFTLVRDESGWICYARLSADGSEYVSTGVRYTGPNSRAPGSQKKLRISKESFESKHRKTREAVGYDNDEMVPIDRRRGQASGGFSPAPAESQKMVGLAVLIDFSDQTTALQASTMINFFNRVGTDLTVNATGGSVYDYFYSISNGGLEYTNIVPPAFVRVDSAKTYYDRGTNYQYVPALLQSAFTKIKAMAESGQLDLSSLSYETAGTGNNQTHTIMAVNVYYAGSATQGWSNGIWPHQGTYRAPSGQTAVTLNVGGRTLRFGRYQLSSLGTGANAPGIGTTIHENGHMIMRWSDLYNYDNTVTNVVASYCVMSSSNGSNPQMPNPYYRERAGWVNVTDITNMNATLTHTANSAEVYIYRRNAQESYYIEARRRSGRSTNIPGEGLIVWHVHTNGVNTALNAQRPYPLVKVIQANNAASTTTAFPAAPGANAPFRAGGGSNNTSFGRTTSPAALYHDGTPSNINITEVSSINTMEMNPVMAFKIGSGGPPIYMLNVVNGTGSGAYEPGDVVTATALRTDASGRPFLRWTSADFDLENIYSCTTKVTMGNAEATVTATYSGNNRIYALPGLIEIDTFAYAQGITGASNTTAGATGNRVGRATAVGNFAEYVADVQADGNYEMSYRFLTARTTSGTILIRDVVNNVILDEVTIPNAPTNTAVMQTVTGKTVSFKKGRALLRLEVTDITGANINIDWFSVGTGPTPVVRSADAARFEYGIRAASSGKVSFSVPSSERVSVKMYDVRGRLAAVLFDGVRNPGVYNVNIGSANGISQGLYIIRMKSGGYSRDVKVHYNK